MSVNGDVNRNRGGVGGGSSKDRESGSASRRTAAGGKED